MHTQKPTNIAAESNNTVTQISIDPLSFAELMMQGRTFSPAKYKGLRNNDNWIGQSVFCLDFDSGIQPDEVIERLKENGIDPNVVYSSFSDSPELRKFRVVLFLDREIQCKLKAKDLILSLMKLFPECDKSCKDYARIFFGSKAIIYFNDNLVSVYDVVPLVESYRSELTLLTEKVVKVKTEYSSDTTTTFQKAIRKVNKKNFDLNKAIERLQILQDFMAGEWLFHAQLFGLATNFKYINGGLDLMIQVMTEWNNKGMTNYSQDKFNMIEQVRNSNYKSQQIKYFSKYAEDAEWKNIFSACIN